jgi:hypothetical protein
MDSGLTHFERQWVRLDSPYGQLSKEGIKVKNGTWGIVREIKREGSVIVQWCDHNGNPTPFMAETPAHWAVPEGFHTREEETADQED